MLFARPAEAAASVQAGSGHKPVACDEPGQAFEPRSGLGAAARQVRVHAGERAGAREAGPGGLARGQRAYAGHRDDRQAGQEPLAPMPGS
jgi:hypothetical protein